MIFFFFFFCPVSSAKLAHLGLWFLLMHHQQESELVIRVTWPTGCSKTIIVVVDA